MTKTLQMCVFDLALCVLRCGGGCGWYATVAGRNDANDIQTHDFGER